jgi:hypothetical protein
LVNTALLYNDFIKKKTGQKGDEIRCVHGGKDIIPMLILFFAIEL